MDRTLDTIEDRTQLGAHATPGIGATKRKGTILGSRQSRPGSASGRGPVDSNVRTVRRASVPVLKHENPVFNQLSKLNPFCTWECAKKFIGDYTTVSHKDDSNFLIDISAGYKVQI